MPPKKVKCVIDSGVKKPKHVTIEIKKMKPAKPLGNIASVQSTQKEQKIRILLQKWNTRKIDIFKMLYWYGKAWEL